MTEGRDERNNTEDKKTNKKTAPAIFKKWWVWAIIVFVIIGIICAGSRKPDTSNGGSDSTSYDSHLDELNPQPVHDDKTGHWYVSTIYESFTMEDLAVDYVNKFIKDPSDVHFVVNLQLKATTVIKDLGSTIDVTTYEYVDKEEHYADKLATGMKLTEYHVDKETGAKELVKSGD